VTLVADPQTAAKRVRELLAAGRTVTATAEAMSLPRSAVLAVITRTSGWLHDPATDRIIRREEEQPAPMPKPAPETEPEPEPQPEPEQAPAEPPPPTGTDTRALLSHLGSLRRELGDYHDPAVAKEVERATTALERLETAITTVQERRDVEGIVTRLREELAAAEARLKGIRSGKVKPRPVATNKTIRAWAAANGIACPDFGRIPASVVEQYENAHRDA